MVGLFDPVQLGAVHLSNRIIMAPLTRARASPDRVPTDLMRSYYCQRASAGLIIAEAASVSPQGVGLDRTPGIWCSAQVEGWRHITDAVHKKGGKIFLQLWHVGRVSDPELLSGQIPVAPSAIACSGQLQLNSTTRAYVTPRALRADEIENVVADFATAAANARRAGFDGIDLHAGNGYLIDQFLHDHSNQRGDKYGGSIENRCRLLLEIVDACIGVWGADRIGVHLSPYAETHAMHDSNPALLYSHVAQSLGQRRLAFLFIREERHKREFTRTLKRLFGGRIIINQDYDYERAKSAIASGIADAVGFGRLFVSNPDLVERLQQEAALNTWDAARFISSGPKGYIDYPTLKAICHESADCSS